MITIQDDKDKIIYLYFQRMQSYSEILTYFKHKYSYAEVKKVISEHIKKYND
jgi:hypothetical protein